MIETSKTQATFSSFKIKYQTRFSTVDIIPRSKCEIFQRFHSFLTLIR